MKHRISFTAALWWVIACLIMGIFLMGTSEKEGRVSDVENRMLQGFPKLTLKNIVNDSFMTGFEGFLSDNFFARDDVVSFSNNLLGVFSVLSEDDVMAMEADEMEAELQNANIRIADAEENVTDPAIEDAAPEEEMSEQDVSQEESPDEALEEVVMLSEGELPISSKRSALYFDMVDGSTMRIYNYEKKDLQTYAKTLRIIQQCLPADGHILFTQIPLASIANRWVYQQDEFAGWGSTVEMMLEDCLEGTERIHVLSTYDILEPYVAGDIPMFYHTDHHWTAEAAYKVFAEMMKQLEWPVIPYDEYDYLPLKSDRTKKGYRDTFNVLYPLLPTQNLVATAPGKYKTMDLMDYEDHDYGAFMNNTQLPWRKVITGANSGRNALVLCDSFGNVFTPYLLAYYNEVHMADFRHGSYDKDIVGGNIAEMIQRCGIDDVYIITSTANGLRKDNSIVYLRRYLTE